MMLAFAAALWFGDATPAPNGVPASAETVFEKLVPSTITYFIENGDLYCFNGKRQALPKELRIQNRPNPNTCQSGDHLLYFESEGYVRVFLADREVDRIQTSLSIQPHFMSYLEGELFVGDFIGPKSVQVMRFEGQTAKPEKSQVVDFEPIFSLYTSGRLFVLPYEGGLWLWLPVAAEIIVLDRDLNLLKRGTVGGLPGELAPFLGEVYSDYLALKDNLADTLKAGKTLADPAAGKVFQQVVNYVEGASGRYIRMEPMGMVLWRNRPTLLYFGLLLKGYKQQFQEKPDPSVVADSQTMEELDIIKESLMLPLSDQFLAGAPEVWEGGRIKGLFSHDQLLFWSWVTGKQHGVYQVRP